MNFSQLECLVALAEQGSFTEAAYSLNLTQSAVSHALAALENELGVMLLERNRKGVVALTSVGQKIMPYARALLCQAAAIEQEAKTAKGQASGKLRVGSLSSFSPGLLASILTTFRQKYPSIEVALFEGTQEEVAEWLSSSLIEVGFMLHNSKGFESTLIATDELCVVVPLGHPLQERSSVKAGELAEEAFIMAKSGCACQVIEMAGLSPYKPQVRYQASDSATVLAMVREGLGISLLPRMLLGEKPGEVGVLEFEPAQYLEIGLAVRSRVTISPVAKLFIQTALSLRNRKVEGRFLSSSYLQD
jgi:DNA-binding transcriptional LysR family regulator